MIKLSGLGAFTADRMSMATALDPILMAAEHNKTKNPKSFLLNPFVRGPLSYGHNASRQLVHTSQAANPGLAAIPIAGDIAEAIAPDELKSLIRLGSMYGEYGAGMTYGGPETREKFYPKLHKELKNHNSEEDDKHQLTKRSAKLGPFDLDRAADVRYYDNRIDTLANNREKHPVQYMLNPMVGGPLAELLARLKRRWAAAEGNSTGLAVANRIPGPNLLTIPYSMYAGGAEKRQNLREGFDDTIYGKPKKEKKAQYTGAVLGVLAARNQ